MALLSGTSGFFKLGSTAYYMDKWKVAMKAGFPKITNWVSGGFRSGVTGVKEATITASGPHNPGNTAITLGTSYSVVLGMDTGVELTVTAVVTAIEVDNSIEDAPRINVTAESNGSFTAAVS